MRFAVGDTIAELQHEGTLVRKVVVQSITSEAMCVVNDHGTTMNWVVYGPGIGWADRSDLQWSASPCSVVPCTQCGGLLGELLAERQPGVRILEEEE